MPFSTYVLSLPRLSKRLIAIGTDTALCLITGWIAYNLRTGVFHALHSGVITAMCVSVLLAIPIFILSGLYRAVFRYEGFSAAVAIVQAMVIYGIFYVLIFTVIGWDKVPRTVGFIQPVLLAVGVALTRGLVRLFLGGEYQMRVRESKLPRVIIYGAGDAGRQLLMALEAGRAMRVVAFVDDDRKLQGCVINGITVYSPKRLARLIANFDAKTVLLAIPSATRSRRKEIIETLQTYKVRVRTLPSLSEIASGKITVGALRELEIDELLGRDPVKPKQELLNKTIAHKVVLVTGAGGSIGSELCRQIVQLEPTVLLLVERAEYALYAIYHELIERTPHGNVRIVPLLADVTNEERMREIMQTWRPATLYHAAAYKHVPMVEHNPLEGIENNVF